MNPILAAMMAGFMNAQQVASVAFACGAVVDGTDRVVFHCVLYDESRDQVLRQFRTRSIPVTSRGMPTSELAQHWCNMAVSSVEFEGLPATWQP